MYLLQIELIAGSMRYCVIQWVFEALFRDLVHTFSEIIDSLGTEPSHADATIPRHIDVELRGETVHLLGSHSRVSEHAWSGWGWGWRWEMGMEMGMGDGGIVYRLQDGSLNLCLICMAN